VAAVFRSPLPPAGILRGEFEKRGKGLSVRERLLAGWPCIFRRNRGYFATILLSALFLWLGNALATKDAFVYDAGERAEVVTARVDRILARDERPMQVDNDTYATVIIYFEATITDGPRKGSNLGARQLDDPFAAIPMRQVQEGDRITMVYNKDALTGEGMWLLQEYDRTGPLLALAAGFFALLILYGGKQGVNTVISLCCTCIAIFAVLIPSILSGHNIYISSLIVCTYIVAMTLALVNGLNSKSLSAAIGCLGGLLVSAVLVLSMDNVLKLTGYVNDESAFLIYINPAHPIDLKAIIFSGILIGALGAILDVSVSMAASLSEITATSPNSTFASLVRSGFNIGRDILGTMTNTLILAYIGSSLSLLLLLIVYSNSVMELLNREMVVVEILQAVAGSVGLLFAIPLTTVSAAYIFTRSKRV